MRFRFVFESPFKSFFDEQFKEDHCVDFGKLTSVGAFFPFFLAKLVTLRRIQSSRVTTPVPYQIRY